MIGTLGIILVVSILALQISSGEGLLCYRCDSKYEDDCLYYPAPLSSYENCTEKPQKTQPGYMRTYRTSHKSEGPTHPHHEQQPLYIRYRYKLCPLLERTVKQYVSIDAISEPSPMEEINYVCGKAVTHDSLGVRVRRGCTPDLFLNGTNACVSHSPSTLGATDVACFCTKDFCNEGGLPKYRAGSESMGILFITLINICISMMIA